MYSFFIGYDEFGAPSFSKFAKSIGATLEDIERFRRHKEFERAYCECSEIRRDYLIDKALTKQFDASTVKFLLTNEFGMGTDEGKSEDGRLDVTVAVVDK